MSESNNMRERFKESVRIWVNTSKDVFTDLAFVLVLFVLATLGVVLVLLELIKIISGG